MIKRGQTERLTIPQWDQASLGPRVKEAECRLGSRVISLDTARIDPSREALTILVVDHTEMGTQLLLNALRGSRHFQVIAPSEDAIQTSRFTFHPKPQVAVISASLEKGSVKGLELSRHLRSAYPDLKVIILLDRSTPESVVTAFMAGAQGVFCRTGSLRALRKCILCVHAGQVWASSKEISYLLESLCEMRLRPLLDAKGRRVLTKREEDVLHGAVDGLKNREIAVLLHLSEHTIKNYMFRIFDKLGVSSRVEMILCALSQHPLEGNANLTAT